MKKIVLIVVVAALAAGVFLPLFKGEPVCKPAVAPPLPEVLPWVRWVEISKLSAEKAMLTWDEELLSTLHSLGYSEVYLLVAFPEWGEGEGEGDGTVWTWTVVQGKYILVLERGIPHWVYQVSIPKKISLWQKLFNLCH